MHLDHKTFLCNIKYKRSFLPMDKAYKKKTIVFIFMTILSIVVSIWTNGLVASDSSASSWTKGYTLILMSNEDITSANQARDYVISHGGNIAILSPPHVMLGWI